tara:strand:- start:435 stop:1052 length:618 start_codon:yes stop_codon:yes gene_type:complete
MTEDQAKDLLRNNLKFSDYEINQLEIFRILLLDYNARYNLISKSTEKTIWSRHILDSAQIMNFFNLNIKSNLVDLGSGAGFPGMIIALFNKNPKFHVKLYEKSPIKRDFLNKVKENLKITVDIAENVYNDVIDSDIIVCRAFKKIEQIIKISRETMKKPHKIIILKGKNAQEEINSISLDRNYSYKLEQSITDDDSKILIINVEK